MHTISLGTFGLRSTSDPDATDGLKDCGLALSFMSVNLMIAKVTRPNSSIGSITSLTTSPGLAMT